MMLAMNFFYISSFYKAFITKGCWVLSNVFSTSIEKNMWFYPLFCFCTILFYCFAYVEPLLHSWNITMLYDLLMCYWYWFCLRIFYVYSSRVLLYSFLFACALIWFWYKAKTEFIKWFRSTYRIVWEALV
jgi:hypothetical protein